MSTGGPGGREVAHRIFAVEFRDATYAFSRGDDERSPNYVVSPTGALMNRLFVVGALTEVEQVNEETVRARIADPTGVFVVYASQYQPDARATLQELEPPVFVAVTGKANTFVPEGGDRAYTSIRPEAVAAVDANTRDHWAVTSAEHTLSRLGRLAAGLKAGESSHEGVDIALEEYDPTAGYVSALYEACIAVLEMVAGERDAVDIDSVDLQTEAEPRTPLSDVIATGREMGIGPHPEPSKPLEEPSSTEPASAAGGPAVDEPEPTTPPESEPMTEAADADAAPDEEVTEVPPLDPDEPVVSADEREAIETEFGTDFATGDEIDPNAASDERPSAAEDGDQARPDDPTETTDEVPSDDASAPDEPGEAASETSLSDRVIDVLAELDDGEGVPREEIIETASERFEADTETIAGALRTAMMDGKCYEPAEDVLRPI